jgi:hypothetical protein
MPGFSFADDGVQIPEPRHVRPEGQDRVVGVWVLPGCFPEGIELPGRSDRFRVSLTISIVLLAVPRELLVRNQIKYMDWQTCPRGDFELQRFFGEVANRLSARAVIHVLRAGWLSTVQGRAVL